MSDQTKKSIVCDSCGKELVEHTSYPARYSLQLKAVNMNINNTGMEYAVMVYPPIKETLHFCGLKCLRVWLNKDDD